MCFTGKREDFFCLLKTTSSEVGSQNLFIRRRTFYVPDYFITFFCVSLFCTSVSLDIFLFFYLIYNAETAVAVAYAISLFPHSICEYFMERKKAKVPIFGRIPNLCIYTVLYLLGFGSIFTVLRILSDTFANGITSSFTEYHFPFFHISNENLCILKIYCCINLVLKSIPQLLIASVLILESYVTGNLAFLLGGGILLNIVIFCQTIATTFPLRRTARVFTTSTCILFNALNKFMATMCACCIYLTIFAAVFKKHKYYVFIVVLLKLIFWVIPCWRVLKAQPIPISKFSFGVYLVLISLVFSFIYIHPFEGLGKLYYYLLYLLCFLFELFVLYLIAEASVESISYYLALKVLMFGFLSVFGLLNVFHKYREESYMLRPKTKSGELRTDIDKDSENWEKSEHKDSREDIKNLGSDEHRESRENVKNGEKDESEENGEGAKNREVGEGKGSADHVKKKENQQNTQEYEEGDDVNEEKNKKQQYQQWYQVVNKIHSSKRNVEFEWYRLKRYHGALNLATDGRY